MTKETMEKLKIGDTVYVACKVDAVFIKYGFIQVSTRDCYQGFNAHEDEVLEPSEDCVSRQAILDNAYTYGNGLEPDGYCVNVEDIQALPPVAPIHKKGKWIEIWDKDRLVILAYKCSECEYMMNINTSHYCPNCGAKMETEA